MIETTIGEEAIKQNLEQFLLVLSVSLSVATRSQVFSLLRETHYDLLLVITAFLLAFMDVRLVNLSPKSTLIPTQAYRGFKFV